MKLRSKQTLITCMTAALLLSGCTAAASQMQTESSSSVSPSDSQSDEASSEPTAQPSETPEESSMSAEYREYTDLSFLTEEQQQVYVDACDMAHGIYGLGGNLTHYFGCQPLTDGDAQSVFEDNGRIYSVYNISYKDFSDLVHRTFTDNCLDATNYDVKFVECEEGLLAVDGFLSDGLAKNCSRWAMEAYPDTYRLISSTEKEVVFTLISHYDRNWSLDPYPGEMDIYTVEKTIRMVNTDSGWKIDEFHTTEFG